MKAPLLSLLCLLGLSLASVGQNHQLLLNRGHNQPIRKILFAGDGSRTLSVDQGGKLVLWDLNLNLVLHSQQLLNTDIRQMQLLGDSLLVVCGEYGLESFRLGSTTLEKHASFAYPYAAFMQAQQQHWLVANGRGDLVFLKPGPSELIPTDTLATRTEGLFWFSLLDDKLYTIGLHAQKVLSLSGKELFSSQTQALAYDYSWNSNSRQLVATAENKLVFFALKGKKIQTKTVPIQGLAVSVQWLSDTEVVAGTNTGALYRVNAARGVSIPMLPQAAGRSFTALAVQQELLALGDFRGLIEVRLRKDMEKVLQLAADEAGQITSMQFSPSGNLLALASYDAYGATLSCWDLRKARVIATAKIPAQASYELQFNEDETTLTSRHLDQGLYRLSLRNKHVLDTLEKPLIPFAPGFGLQLPDLDEGLQNALMINELQELANRPGEYSFSLGSGSTPLTGHYRVPDPGRNTKSSLPSARLVESLFQQAGLAALDLDFDQLEKDLLYAKASTYEWPRFLAYASERKIPEQQARKFYTLIRGGAEHQYSLSLRDAAGNERYQHSFSSPLQFIHYQAQEDVLVFFSSDSAYYSSPTETRALPLPASLYAGEPERLLVRAHGRWLALSRGDHIELINVAAPANTLFLYLLGSNYLIHDASGYYMASGRSALLAAQLEGGVLPIESIDKAYNRPDLLLARLPRPDSLLLQLYQKVLQQSEKETRHTPYLPAEKGGSFLGRQAAYPLQFRYDPQHTPRSVALWVNGSPYTPEHIRFDANTSTAHVEVALSGGINRLEWQLQQADNSRSLTATRHVYLPGNSPQKNKLYFFGMGLARYQNSSYNLKYGPKDIADVLSTLASNPAYELVVDTLLNESATAPALRRWKQGLQQAGVNDVVMVYLAGHGLLDASGDFYFGTYDFDMAVPAEKGILLDSLKALITNSRARKRLMLIDACQSGNSEFYHVVGRGAQAHAPAAGAPGSRGAREVDSDGPAAQEAEPVQLLQELFGAIRGSGIDIIGASSASQFAYEGLGLQNGAFSYFVIRGLETGAADSDGDGLITITELKTYVSREVSAFTGGKQKPTSREENNYYNWRIY